eukprot:CAMPEP_0178920626 /NCGR_PEP_ID=MMETSP0786-20121207/15106_1 /TAXON_ID=186022 /ORGANISM="Thalassionema frauenfeldii, Strain CCMP 1798" /LENGTH=767 /DNA_ID=CAMNT_0020594707 /DNA_START=43 /DNA_END=2346 /DNA_ORIENTATION=-
MFQRNCRTLLSSSSSSSSAAAAAISRRRKILCTNHNANALRRNTDCYYLSGRSYYRSFSSLREEEDVLYEATSSNNNSNNSQTTTTTTITTQQQSPPPPEQSPPPPQQQQQQQQQQEDSDHTPSKPLKEVRKQLWEFYVSTGRGANALFEAIDLREVGEIHPSELKAFLEEVWSGSEHPKEIMPYAWNILELRTKQNSMYTTKTFKQWLIAATKMSADQKNQRTLAYFQQSKGMKEEEDNEDDYSWNSDSMSQSLRRMQYAVRGEVVMRANQLEAEGKNILYTNIGNPHQVGQSPITYYRQVMALCDLPAEVGVDHPSVGDMFPPDVIERAKELRDIIGPSGTGAYTHSQGLLGIRQHVAEFIQERDGGTYPSHAGNIFLTNGASAAIAMVLQGLIGEPNDAVLIPIPQYPIYSAMIAKMGGRQVGYELSEDLNWTVTRNELERCLEKAQSEGLTVKAMAMINPGNPSGNIMTHCDIQTVVEFCASNKIVLLADEVYQTNVYSPHSKFVSAKQVAYDTGLEKELQLVSFHSTSKGLVGECGRRGGYMELHHIDPYVQSQMYKLASSELCSGLQGQIMVSLMVRGPRPGDGSYELYKEETRRIFEGLKERSQKLVRGLNLIDGVCCAPADGAMYAFPRLENLPESVFRRAKELGTTPDNLYALSLLESTGICVVPASGFGQSKGRVGFRTTFLHPDTVRAIDKFREHHYEFMDKYTKLQHDYEQQQEEEEEEEDQQPNDPQQQRQTTTTKDEATTTKTSHEHDDDDLE